ncbi:MAG: pantoate--beta-alanine ligase [Erythrobacter sp.]
MQTADTLDVLRKQIAALNTGAGGSDLPGGPTIGLVPTMGALHDGHLTLVRRAREECDHVVASIFVNPTQFGPGEDLDAYPRQLQADAEMLAAERCDILWAPSAAEMYPDGFVSSISVTGVSEGLCGADRPGHFDGVATVVCKLFHQVRPTHAFFGEKDFQQLAVIRAMARDLDLMEPHVRSIIGVPTAREPDGLAMSSRNRYLSEDDRASAAALPRAMKAAIANIEDGKDVTATLADLRTELFAAGFAKIDYAVLADSASLAPLAALGDRAARLLVAARIGGVDGSTRLIDNMAVG